MSRIAKYRIELVKESNHNYDFKSNIGCPADSYNMIKDIFNLENQAEEVLALLALDTKNKVVGAFEVSRGTLNASMVHPREVFKRALLVNAATIILAHNHPSGNPQESSEDVALTVRIKEAGKIIGIELLDHMIIGEGSYQSLKEVGII